MHHLDRPQGVDISESGDHVKSQPKVLYILGWGRSGSTLLANLLGGIDGFFCVGELHYLWERGILEGRLCGCGKTLENCEFWRHVIPAALEQQHEYELLNPADVLQWQDRAVRVRHTWRLLHSPTVDATGTPSSDDPSERYLRLISQVYEAVSRQSGANVIVDSSKRPSDAALLLAAPNVAVYFLHLVRDPRAVAFSWQRKKDELDVKHRALMSRHGAIASTLYWTSWNLLSERVRRDGRARGSLLVRYEDFIEAPERTLRDVTHLLGENADLPIRGSRARLVPNHSVAGNPGRFANGNIELRKDDEWIRNQSVRERAMATALSLPILPLYRYPLRIHRGPQSVRSQTN